MMRPGTIQNNPGHPNPGKLNPGHIHAGPSGRIYVIGWAVAATLALAYLAALAVRPDLLVAHAIGRPHDLESNQGDRLIAQGTGAALAPQSNQADIEALKAAILASEDRERALHARIAALEARMGEGQQTQVSARGNAADAAAANPIAAQPNLIEGHVVELPPTAASPTKGASQPAKLPVAAAASLPGTVIASIEPQKMYGIALASGPSLEALRLSWSLLTDRHKATLAELDARYLIQSDANAPFQLVAGPFPSEAKARQVCAVLLARKAACKVGEFGGNAL